MLKQIRRTGKPWYASQARKDVPFFEVAMQVGGLREEARQRTKQLQSLQHLQHAHDTEMHALREELSSRVSEVAAYTRAHMRAHTHMSARKCACTHVRTHAGCAAYIVGAT